MKISIAEDIKKLFTSLKNKFNENVNIKQALSKLLSIIQRSSLKTQNLESMFCKTGSLHMGETKLAVEQIDVIQKCQTTQILCEEMSKKFKDKEESLNDVMELWIELKKDANIALALDVCNIPEDTLEEITFAFDNNEEKQKKINSKACLKIAKQAREYKRQYKKEFAEYVKIVKDGVKLQKTLKDLLETLESISDDSKLTGKKGAFKPIKKICDTSIKKCKKLTKERAELINLFAGSLYNFRGYTSQAISYEHPYDDAPPDEFYCNLNI